MSVQIAGDLTRHRHAAKKGDIWRRLPPGTAGACVGGSDQIVIAIVPINASMIA